MLLASCAGYHRASFADMVKQAVASRFAIRVEDLYRDEDKLIPSTEERARAGMPGPMTVRQLVHWYGVDIVMKRHNNHWVIGMDKCLKLVASKGVPGVIIDDVCFPNEANLVKRWHGFLFRLEPYPGYMAPPAVENSPVESALDKYRGFDAVYQPEYGEAGLRTVAELILHRLKG